MSNILLVVTSANAQDQINHAVVKPMLDQHLNTLLSGIPPPIKTSTHLK